MEKETLKCCEECIFWVRNGGYPKRSTSGECRFNPPKQGFPETKEYHWCGKFESKEKYHNDKIRKEIFISSMRPVRIGDEYYEISYSTGDNDD